MATSNVVKNRARKTTIALKVVMAITGLFFIFFLLLHMYGNLKMFAGAEAYNGYAEWLRTLLAPALPYKGGLWALRILLIVSIVAHVYCAFKLWLRASHARGNKYKVNSGKKVGPTASYYAMIMRWGGLALALFIVFHILQFTTLTLSIGADYSAITPYERMVAGFSASNWWVWLIYFIALCSLTLHVRHGLWSAFATLGIATGRAEFAFKAIANLAALALIVGFMVPPTAILLGFIA